ncbi:MAG: hypothetical protein K5840_03665 [Eubacterium sp.]|nr:hypothetical protein [Eubacterium sp.]
MSDSFTALKNLVKSWFLLRKKYYLMLTVITVLWVAWGVWLSADSSDWIGAFCTSHVTVASWIDIGWWWFIFIVVGWPFSERKELQMICNGEIGALPGTVRTKYVARLIVDHLFALLVILIIGLSGVAFGLYLQGGAAAGDYTVLNAINPQYVMIGTLNFASVVLAYLGIICFMEMFGYIAGRLAFVGWVIFALIVSASALSGFGGSMVESLAVGLNMAPVRLAIWAVCVLLCVIMSGRLGEKEVKDYSWVGILVVTFMLIVVLPVLIFLDLSSTEEGYSEAVIEALPEDDDHVLVSNYIDMDSELMDALKAREGFTADVYLEVWPDGERPSEDELDEEEIEADAAAYGLMISMEEALEKGVITEEFEEGKALLMVSVPVQKYMGQPLYTDFVEAVQGELTIPFEDIYFGDEDGESYNEVYVMASGNITKYVINASYGHVTEILPDTIIYDSEEDAMNIDSYGMYLIYN